MAGLGGVRRSLDLAAGDRSCRHPLSDTVTNVPVPAEIERKFLVAERPDWLDGCRSEALEQGYLAIGPDDEVRLRRSEDRARLTVKRGHGEERLEQEVEIGEEQLAALWPLTEGRRVEKRRYSVDGDPAIEVDVYAGELEGLITAEVEFPSREDAERFSPPNWLGEEVTGDDRYANQRLALHGLPRRYRLEPRERL
jgi:adenylate cyclase